MCVHAIVQRHPQHSFLEGAPPAEWPTDFDEAVAAAPQHPRARVA